MNTLTTTDASRLFDWCHDPVQVCWDKADGCLGIFCISNHRYSYSMGIGDALYLQALNYDGTWRGGSAYNHGMLPPRYPVPAVCITSAKSGNVRTVVYKGRLHLFGPTAVWYF